MLTTHSHPVSGRRSAAVSITFVSLLALVLSVVAGPTAQAKGKAAAAQAERNAAQAYVQEFWPIVLSNEQTTLIAPNNLLGPTRITPVYQSIVAINNDTLYASSLVDLRSGDPVIVTIPEAGVDQGYSVLQLDMTGNVLDGLIPSKSAGSAQDKTVYALVPPGYSGSVPDGSVRVDMSQQFSVLIFRVDRYVGSADLTAEADAFRRSIQLQPLSEYDPTDATAGATRILPVAAFSFPFKTVADELVRTDPILALRGLQEGVQSYKMPPLTARQQQIADDFDGFFGQDGANVTKVNRAAFSRGARAGHDAIIDNYLDNRDGNNWIHFTNMGNWADTDAGALDRSSIAEFLQWGNGIETAAYYHTFEDEAGKALTGKRAGGYQLTFPPGDLPPFERFWSVTAYTPQAIELIPNPIDKYLVASYTPGLETNPDGSTTIHIAQEKPDGVPEANWLPVSDRDFNVMLRVYGVPADSTVANNTYRPPPVQRCRPQQSAWRGRTGPRGC